MNFLKKIFNPEKHSTNHYPVNKSFAIDVWKANELETFRKNLKQVIWWTEILAEKFDMEKEQCGAVFRKTNPELNGTRLYKIDQGYTTWQIDDDSHDDYDKLLELAIAERPAFNCDYTNLNEFGRILCFQTAVTTHDGAPIIGSELFLDESDVPPIDTWFYLKRNYPQSRHYSTQTLFSWVPKKFESVVQQGIDVEMLDSYRWLDENDPAAYEYIRNG